MYRGHQELSSGEIAGDARRATADFVVPDPSSSSRRSREHPFSKLLDPKRVDLFGSRLKEVDTYIEAKRKLTTGSANRWTDHAASAEAGGGKPERPPRKKEALVNLHDLVSGHVQRLTLLKLTFCFRSQPFQAIEVYRDATCDTRSQGPHRGVACTERHRSAAARQQCA